MKKVKDKQQVYECPECGSNNLIVTEETAFYLNGIVFYCHSVKAQDGDAKVQCLDCNWTGFRSTFGNDS